MDGFNRVGGLSGNKGRDSKVKILKADSQISEHEQIEGWGKRSDKTEGENPRRVALCIIYQV